MDEALPGWVPGRRERRFFTCLVALVSTACGDPTVPEEYRGVGLYLLDPPAEIVRLNDRVLVLDISFAGPCQLLGWDVRRTTDRQEVEIIPYYTARVEGGRCGPATTRLVEAFRFFEGDSARFIIKAQPSRISAEPLEVVLDTVVAFEHAFQTQTAADSLSAWPPGRDSDGI
jgi:hypothetical protein